jgi:cytidylate kinase
VYCYAPVADLARYAIEHLGIPASEAKKKVLEVNHQREAFVKLHWGRDWRDVANYDLCVNTAQLGLDQSAELVIQVARARFG